MKELRLLQERASKALSRRREEFDIIISAGELSRLAFGISSECSIHLEASSATFFALSEELQQWILVERPNLPAYAEQREQIDTLAWSWAIWALDNFVRILEPKEIEEYLELLKVIVEKGAALLGLEWVKTFSEIVAAIKQSRDIWKVRQGDIPKAQKVLVEFETFMTTSLAACQFASAQVHGLTQRLDLADLPREKAGPIVMSRARDFVSEKVRQARQNIANGRSFILFPRDGFWIGTPAFESVIN